MFSLQQKGKFDLGTFCLDDALHLFGRIPDGHIATSCAWGAAGWRISDVNQEVLGRTFIAQPTKVRWECDAIERFGHNLFPSLYFYGNVCSVLGGKANSSPFPFWS